MFKSSHRLVTPLTLALAVAACPAFAAVPLLIVVDSAADTVANDGSCTLREAILSANTHTASGNAAGECAAVNPTPPPINTINFNIPDTDAGCTGTPRVCTIKPAAANWPRITAPVKIDGYSQPGSSANTLATGDDAVVLIELDASNLTTHALYLAGPSGGGDSSGSTIQGLAITHVGNGLSACYSDGSSNDIVTGNFIGTDPAGTAVTSPSGQGIDFNNSTGATIGGSTPAERNVLATGGEVVHLVSSNNTLQGNYIGIDKTGTTALPSGRGIDVEVGSGNLIGGATAGAGNVVGTWTDFAIIVQSGSNNHIQGNLIGTDASGTMRVGGGGVGVADYNGTGTGNKIGGDAAGEGNLIEGAVSGFPGAGVLLWFDTASDLVVQGNVITRNAAGVFVYAGAGIVGGTTAGAGNRIAFNDTSGVTIFAGAKNVPILGNEIFGNGGLRITLSGANTPTPNDDGDADSGNNNLQNYPVIGPVTIDPATTVHFSGSLNSETDKTYLLEFFANASCDQSGNGEGKIPIHSMMVTANPNDVAFGTLDIGVPADRHVITATATELVGVGLVPGSTSEFSICSTQDTIFSDGVNGN